MLDAPNTNAPAVPAAAIVVTHSPVHQHYPSLQIVPVQAVDFYPEPKEAQCSQS